MRRLSQLKSVTDYPRKEGDDPAIIQLIKPLEKVSYTKKGSKFRQLSFARRISYNQGTITVVISEENNRVFKQKKPKEKIRHIVYKKACECKSNFILHIYILHLYLDKNLSCNDCRSSGTTVSDSRLVEPSPPAVFTHLHWGFPRHRISVCSSL